MNQTRFYTDLSMRAFSSWMQSMALRLAIDPTNVIPFIIVPLVLTFVLAGVASWAIPRWVVVLIVLAMWQFPDLLRNVFHGQILNRDG